MAQALMSAIPPIPINHDRLQETFVALLAVDSYYGDEERVVEVIKPRMDGLGVSWRSDPHGNLIGTWPARGKEAEPLILNAHMDTVLPTPNMVPIVKPDGVYSDGSSVLGADDKAGVAAIMEAIQAFHDSNEPHGPIELLFTTGEDVGHIGSKAFDAQDVVSRRCFVFDAGGPVGTVVMRAPGQRRFVMTFKGKAAHAGVEPELGISAIAIAARAIDQMPLGRVDETTTANVGTIEGGQAYNIVAPEATVTVESRSLSEERLERQVTDVTNAATQAAETYGGTVEIETHTFYTAYELEESDPAVQLADTAIEAAGMTTQHVSTGGGSDAHEFNEKGITSVCLGMGYIDVHSVNEFMPHNALRDATRMAVELIRHG